MKPPPTRGWSAGIGVFLTQLPSAKAKKSSPGATDLSIQETSIPASVPGFEAVLPVCVLHAASASAGMTNQIDERIIGWPFLVCALPTPAAAARRAAGFFDQRARPNT